jgi:hypothetical protein
MDDPRFFSVRLIGLPHDWYKCIIVDLCVSVVHVLKLQLVSLVVYGVTLASSIRFWRVYCSLKILSFQQTGTNRLANPLITP